MLIVLLALLAALILYLIFPARLDSARRALFSGRAFAHRGLHDLEAGIPENSLPAFAAAMEAGYGCELDIQLSRDGRLVVFHDDDLLRGCGLERPVRELTYEELSRLSLFGTGHRIPLFSEVLELVNGRGPLIVELKTARPDSAWNQKLCESALAALRAYGGVYCIESFDPTIVAYFRKNAPDIVRGQLAEAARHYTSCSRLTAFIVANLLSSFMTRPHFIAYEKSEAGPALALSRSLGAVYAPWTCREPATHDARIADGQAVIFEHYRPTPNPEGSGRW